MRIKILLFVVINLLVHLAHCQPVQLSNIRFWGANEGLLNRNVRAIAQDSEGFIWLGTTTGLVRFDGRNFVSIKQIVKSHSLGFEFINSLLSVGSTLWVGTDDGLYKLNSLTYEVEKICLPFKNKRCLSNFKIDQLLQLNNGTIIIDGTEEGIWLLDTLNNFIMLEHPMNKPFAKVKSYAVDGRGDVWFCSAGKEIFRLNHATQRIDFFREYPTEFNGVCYTPQFGLTVRNHDEMYLFNPQKNSFTSTQNKLFTKATAQLAEHNKGVWQARAGNELHYFDGNKSYDFSYIFDKIEEGSFIIVFIKRIKNQIWIGTNYGLIKADVSIQRYPHFFSSNPAIKKEKNHSVRGMTEAKNHDIYFGSYQGLFKIPFPYNPNKIEEIIFDSIQNYMPYCISLDNEILWIGSEGGGISRFNLTTKVHKRYKNFTYPYDNKFIISMLNDRSYNRIIFGSYEGLILFNKSTEIFKRINLRYQNVNFNDAKIFQISRVKNDYWICTGKGLIKCDYNFNVTEYFNLKHRQVACLYYDTLTNTAWVGTIGEGLFSITPNKKVINYSFKDGLPDDNIVSILAQNNKLYIGTYYGLSVFNPQERTFSNIHTQQGISHNEFNHGASLINSFGNIFIGGVNGYNLIDKKVNYTESKNTNTPFIASVFLLNGDQETKIYNGKSTHTLFIPNNNKVIELEFGLSDYIQPERSIYAYKIEGIDNDWVYLGNRNNIRLTELNAGTYQLLLRAAGSDGKWRAMPEALTITIDQKFYLKWWFIMLEVLVLCIAVISFYRIKINQVKKMFNLRLQISSDLHDEVGSILTAVGMQAEIVQHVNAEDKNTQLQQIAETSRQAVSNMRDVVWSIDSRNDKIKNLVDRMNDYLLLMFENSDTIFEFKPEVNNENSIDLETRQNTYLIFKETINNIAKHACAQKIKIVLIINNKTLFLDIANDGVNNANTKSGMGLKNMHMRAAKMRASLTIDVQNKYRTTLVKQL